MEKPVIEQWMPKPVTVPFRPREIVREPMEFLSRSWSVSALEVSRALSSSSSSQPVSSQQTCLKGLSGGNGVIKEDVSGQIEDIGLVTSNPFAFASSETSQMVMERIMSQSVSVAELWGFLLRLLIFSMLICLFLATGSISKNFREAVSQQWTINWCSKLWFID